MFKRKRVALSIILVFLFATLSFWGFISRHYVLPILMYHSINPETNPVMKALIVSPGLLNVRCVF